MQNQTIYGFHFTDNYGYVNYNGYLIVPDKPDDDEVNNFSKYEKKIDSYKIQMFKQFILWINQKKDIKARQKMSVEFAKVGQKMNLNEYQVKIITIYFQFQILEISGQKKCGPAFIHFDFAGFNGQFLGQRDKFLNKYHQCLMTPPTQTLFFWTLGKKQLYAKNYGIHNLEGQLVKNVQIGEKEEKIRMHYLNFIKQEEQKQLFNQYYTPLISVLPRNELTHKSISIKEKIAWNKNNSLFKDWRPDHEILQACFEVDWDNTRITRIIKDPADLQATKLLLKSHYRQIKDYYKYFASLNPAQEIWYIINQCSIVDDKLLRIQDVDIKFIAACSDPVFKGNARNPERGLVRHQFLEFLLRIADDKYIKNNIANSYEKGVQMLLNECLPIFTKFEEQSWRDNKY